MKNRFLTTSLLAASTLFGGMAFAERAEAGSYLPKGNYKNGEYTMRVTSGGDYRIFRVRDYRTEVYTSGVALHEGASVCTSGATKGNLWTVTHYGSGECYSATVRGNRLVIDDLGDPFKALGGVWVRQ